MTPETGAPSPRTLVKHELAGLRVRVIEATSRDLVGIEGVVVNETRNTLRVETDDGEKILPKRDATFAFELEGAVVEVVGEELVAPPARRTETAGGSVWQ